MPIRRPIPINLTSITTADKETLSGVYVDAQGKKEWALIWVHGLTSAFDNGQTLMGELASRLPRNGIGYLKFHNRGHHVAYRGARGMLGGGYERFEDSIHDIRAMIKFARSLDYTKFLLAGHSTGANKVIHYLRRTNDRSVKGLILAGPVSDIGGLLKKVGRKRWLEYLAVARRLYANDPKAMMVKPYSTMTAARFISMYTPGKPEDTFPYYDPKVRWSAMKTIRTPIFVVFGQRDDYLDAPARQVVTQFKTAAVNARSFTDLVIPGASHGFHTRSRELASAVVSWSRRIARG